MLAASFLLRKRNDLYKRIYVIVSRSPITINKYLSTIIGFISFDSYIIQRICEGNMYNSEKKCKNYKKNIILASGSPRRKELMELAGYEFEIKISHEEEVYTSTHAEDIVKELALLKAKDIARQVEGSCIVIGADTVVALDGLILGKPASQENAIHMIEQIQGRVHQVYTGVAIIEKEESGNDKVICHAVKTDVYVNAMSQEEILHYVESEEVMDKAGAYGIQGKFAVYIERIDGDYYNVMGLPISYIYRILKKIGV